jgi:uncharacterized membrane protein
MNFEELKSDWEKEPSGEVNVPATTNTFLKSKQPIEKIREQLKKDFWGQVIGTLIMGFYPQIFDNVVDAFMKNAPSPVIFPKEFYAYYYVQYFIMVIIEVYFIVRFTMFYQYLNYKSVNTLESLYEIYYEIKLKIETWRTWCIALIPYYLVLVVLSWLSFKVVDNVSINKVLNENVTVLSVIVVVVFGVMFWLTEWTIKHNYSKIMSQLKGLLDELKEAV